MTSETNQNTDADVSSEGEVSEESVTLSKSEYAKLNETIGSLKRNLKDFTKAKAEETPKNETKSDNELLKRLDKMALQVAGITEVEDVELFNSWKERTKMGADEIVKDDIFQSKLESQRTARANLKATSDVKGEPGSSSAKNDPSYWISKATKGEDGKLRFPEDTPKELYAKIVSKLGEGEPGASKGKLSFYNK